jgi:hypothetical protein
MNTNFRETVKVNTALTAERGEPLITVQFDFNPEFKGNSYEFQHTYMERLYGAMGELLRELQAAAIWEEGSEESKIH